MSESVIYLSSPEYLHGTELEKEIKEFLAERLECIVISPSDEQIKQRIESERNGRASEEARADVLEEILGPVIRSCDGLAFLSYPDKKIDAGVMEEINIFSESKKRAGLPAYIREFAIMNIGGEKYMRVSNIKPDELDRERILSPEKSRKRTHMPVVFGVAEPNPGGRCQ